MNSNDFSRLGEELEQLLKLRTHPIAVKMLKTEADIPEGAMRPKKDRGYHLAQCQVFSLARRQGLTIAMLKEDHWCWAPLMAYGMVEDPQDEFVNAHTSFPRFEPGTYVGIVSGPLGKANYIPDLVLVYLTPAQLRQCLLSIKFADKTTVKTEFDPIDSCTYDIVPVIKNNEYRITVPDPGEHARASAADDEMILSVPADRVATLVEGLKQAVSHEDPYSHIEMHPDFIRPPFYDDLSRKWGLDTSDDLKK